MTKTNLITGFLGSGKTTSILHLLDNKPANEKWAVLVNEFGEVGIDGALLAEGEGKTSPVGKMFIQPKVTLETGQVTLLDEVIGARFAIIAWGCNPRWGLTDEQIARWRAVGVQFIQVVPEVQIHCDQDNVPGVIRVGDTQNRLKNWFAQHDTAIAVVRPDRFVATVAIPQTLGKKLNALASKMQLASAQAPTVIEQVA